MRELGKRSILYGPSLVQPIPSQSSFAAPSRRQSHYATDCRKVASNETNIQATDAFAEWTTFYIYLHFDSSQLSQSPM